MIDPTKLLRSALLALALLFLAPMGVGGALLGVEAAQAATVSKITVIGNKQVDTSAVIKYLALKVGDEDAGTLTAKPAVSIGGVSAEVITLQLQPASGARLVVADALAGNRTLAYSLKGTVSATPQEKKQRSFDVDSRSTLNQAPGLPGVLR